LEDDASTVYRLTIADLMKLQGFEESFQVFGSKTQQLRQIGNTIPTNLTKIIATQIKKHLRTS
jgi:site-specific DNA-cytosine methylase